jgi:peroxin-2
MILRTSQLDAIELDKELVSNLNAEISNVFNRKYEAEVAFLVDFLVYGSQILLDGSTYGLKIQNLIYRSRNGRRLNIYQKLFYVTVRMMGKWLTKRLSDHMMINEWANEIGCYKQKVWLFMQKLESIYNALSLINFILFIRNGTFLTLLDRIMGIRLIHENKEMSRLISFEYMNRQLVWQAFSEFYLAMSPYLRLAKLTRRLIPKNVYCI